LKNRLGDFLLSNPHLPGSPNMASHRRLQPCPDGHADFHQRQRFGVQRPAGFGGLPHLIVCGGQFRGTAPSARGTTPAVWPASVPKGSKNQLSAPIFPRAFLLSRLIPWKAPEKNFDLGANLQK